MIQLWAKLDIQYKVNLKLIKDTDIAQGFKISIKNYKRLKERVKNIAIKIKFKHVIYRGNTTIIKEEHVEEFYKQLLQFANALPD